MHLLGKKFEDAFYLGKSWSLSVEVKFHPKTARPVLGTWKFFEDISSLRREAVYTC